ncbi:hypothetical protein BU25DRAFT_494851 [Macroventuria anomochaeta]|uniref:Uncharacterized protein n=1 Tax=Macroventuria anomochaeta TaxID=301207 RepID=A0ACB6RLF8_9PLEO|nr:uncharacterized protein BU25DRAFT_494851 [Macroventuria anomochaeta]KAF2622770.1 hypothetical protein BU25DRAFT_494851 [Macroventuria anomochaeta]
MAGTRRQPRARNTTSTHQRQRSASQVASIVSETASAMKSKVIEIAESADEGSPRPESSPQLGLPINRSITAFCKKCDGKIGEFYNSWHKVTSSYYSPALLGSYRSLLRTSDQRKEALDSTELAGCIIDLTCCPNCDYYLGFVVVDTPAGGKRFRGREFFKLQHIELRCETSQSKTITVEPQENVALDLVAPEGSTSPSPTPGNTIMETMELDTPLSSSHPLWSQPAQSELLQQRQQSQPREPVRPLLQTNTSQPPVAISRSPSNRSAPTLATAPDTIPSQKSPQLAQPQSGHTIRSSVLEAQPKPVVNGHKDGHNYPRESRKVYFDAIERLQTQTSQNTSALAAQARTQVESADMVRQIEGSLRHDFLSQIQRQDQELRRMGETVSQLLQQLQDCRQTIVNLAQEVHVTRAENVQRPSEVVQSGYQDDALELMARRIGEISHRTTDLETLRDHVAILGGRVQRLESETPARQPHPHSAYPAHQPTHAAHIAHAAPSHSSQVSSFQTPARPTSVPQPVPQNETPAALMPPESAQRHESAPSQNGWATVNAGVKRVFENGIDSPQGASPAPGSPKRPRLVTGGSQDGPSMPQNSPGSSHILPSQTQPVVASQPLTQPGPYPGLPSSQPYPPHSTQDGPSDHSWRPESQRMADSRPARGRGSRGGRGPGSRGGRVRKSMQGQHHPVGTPEWEGNHWTAVPDSQASPSDFGDHPAHPGRSTVRRGGGGSGSRASSLLMERSSEWTPEIAPRGVLPDQGSPIEVKKTRSKPVRNEDGILVRKDGRPDRRSQSSAANLRKVHARKEEQQREGEVGTTPTGLHPSMSAGPDTPSPTSRGHPEQNVTDSMRKKHNNILGRIFPEGIDTSRKQHDYAHQVFNENHDHTAHPRTQSSRTTKTPLQIKKEQAQRSEVTETQASVDGDVEMGDAGTSTNSHTHDNTHTPSGETVEVPNQGGIQRAQDQADPEQESRVQIPETQATDGSATLIAESVEAA